MEPDAALRVFHVSTGFLGLTLGPIAMWASKSGRLHPRIGGAYLVVMTATCASAAALAVLDWSNSFLFFVAAVGTYAFALAGYAAAKTRRPGWLVVHAVGVTSSYCGLVMAFLVTNLRVIPALREISFMARLLPLMFLSTCVVVWVGLHVYRGRLPQSVRERPITAS